MRVDRVTGGVGRGLMEQRAEVSETGGAVGIVEEVSLGALGLSLSYSPFFGVDLDRGMVPPCSLVGVVFVVVKSQLRMVLAKCCDMSYAARGAAMFWIICLRNASMLDTYYGITARIADVSYEASLA